MREQTSSDFLACIPHAIQSHWDNVWAPRLAGFPVNIVYASRTGDGLTQATYVFDPSTFVAGEQFRQMRYYSTIESVFSVLVVVYSQGRIETFKYRGPDMIHEACGPEFQTAMIHTTACGVASDEPSEAKLGPCELGA